MEKEKNPINSYSVDNPVKIRGRWFSHSDLEVIRGCVDQYYEEGRTKISIEICKILAWKQPNGWFKDRACRDVLIHLDKLGIITLPPRMFECKRKKGCVKITNKNHLEGYDFNTRIDTLSGEIELEFAKGNDCEKVWNELVDRYHYLGYRPAVGRCIKYLIKNNGTLLGAISFSSPAWKITARDSVLNKIGIDPHEQVVNNSRFLILPHVNIPNLASHSLSLSTKRIVEDWSWYYSLTPLVAETFVQPSTFYGTCYKAANWIEIGITKGYAKKGSSYSNGQEPKKMFLYGLNRITRVKLISMFVNNQA